MSSAIIRRGLLWDEEHVSEIVAVIPMRGATMLAGSS